MKKLTILLFLSIIFANLSAQNTDGIKNLEQKADQKMKTLQNNVEQRMKNLRAYMQNEKDWNQIVIGEAVETPISEEIDTTIIDRIEPMLPIPEYVDNTTNLEEELQLIKMEIEKKVESKPQQEIIEEIKAKGEITIPDQAQSSKVEIVSEKEIKEKLLEIEKTAIPSICPISDQYFISSGFGKRFHPILLRYKFHNGIDLAALKGTNIYATALGTVVKSGKNGNYGNYILIQHENGYETAYAHLNSIDVKVGEKVQQSDKIGTVGSTGRSTGYHLHYEVIKNKKRVNPQNYM